MGTRLYKYLGIAILNSIVFALDQNIKPIDEYTAGAIHTKENRNPNTITDPRHVQFEYVDVLDKGNDISMVTSYSSTAARRSLSTAPHSATALPSMSYSPTNQPSHSSAPTVSISPSSKPSMSFLPSIEPTVVPSSVPSYMPSDSPEMSPSFIPTETSIPTQSPSLQPTTSSQPSHIPSSIPSSNPSLLPTLTMRPSSTPSMHPTLSLSPSSLPSSLPSFSKAPSSIPSNVPSLSLSPSVEPSSQPTKSISPTALPSMLPSNFPSLDKCKAYGGPTYGNVDKVQVMISFTYGIESNLTVHDVMSEKIALIEPELLDLLILELFTFCKVPTDDNEVKNRFSSSRTLRGLDNPKPHLHSSIVQRSSMLSSSTPNPSHSTKPSIETSSTVNSYASPSMSLRANGLRGSTITPSMEESENSVSQSTSSSSSSQMDGSSMQRPIASTVEGHNEEPSIHSSMSRNTISTRSSPSGLSKPSLTSLVAISQSPSYSNDGSIVGLSMFPPDLANGYKCKAYLESNGTDVSCLEVTGRLSVYVSDSNDADEARLLVLDALERVMDDGLLNDIHPSILGVSFLNETERTSLNNPFTDNVSVKSTTMGSGKIWATAGASLFVVVFFIGISRYRCYATFREEHGNRAEDNESNFVDVLEYAEWLQRTGQSLFPDEVDDKSNDDTDESDDNHHHHQKYSDEDVGAASSVSKSIGSKSIEEKKARLRELERQYAAHASEESFAIAAAQRSLDEAKKAKLKEIEELYTNLQYSLSRQASVQSLGSRKSKVSFNVKTERIEVSSLHNDSDASSREDDFEEERERGMKVSSSDPTREAAYEESETLADFSKVAHRDEDSAEGIGDYGEIWIDDNAQVFDDDESFDDGWDEDPPHDA